MSAKDKKDTNNQSFSGFKSTLKKILMGPLVEGIILGLTLAIFFGFGPALLALMQTSIHRGFWSAVLLAVGIFLSDLLLVALSFFGAIKLMNTPGNKLLFGIISGVILIIFGIVTFSRKAKINGNGEINKDDAPGPLTLILKGFFMNVANPFVWIFWMGVVVGFTSNYSRETSQMIVFFSASLLTVLIVDILKSFLAFRIKKYMTIERVEWVNKIAGLGLGGFGIFLIIRTILEF